MAVSVYSLVGGLGVYEDKLCSFSFRHFVEHIVSTCQRDRYARMQLRSTFASKATCAHVTRSKQLSKASSCGV
jgi:hypothetical protein